MSQIYKVMVYWSLSEEEKTEIDLCDTAEQMQNMTVKQLKEKIVEKLKEQAGSERWIRLFFNDKVLKGDSTLLSEYGIQHMSNIEMGILNRGPRWTGGDGMGDKGGKNLSMENLSDFETPSGSNFDPQ